MTDNENNSFLSPQARGGDIAQGGFSFQDNIVLSRIPYWLSDEGFERMSHEAQEDIEAVFFVPGIGSVMEAIQVKDHALTQTEFREAIEQFQRLDAENPSLYRRFVLVSTGAERKVRPAINSLKRVQSLYPFYPEGALIREKAYQEYVTCFRDGQEAHFVYSKVSIEPNWNVGVSGESLFRDALVKHFPEFRQASIDTIGIVYDKVTRLVRGKRAQIIPRRELEDCVFGNLTYALRPVRIHTSYELNSVPAEPVLHLQWSPLFGGRERALPSTDVWNEQFIKQCQEVRSWILRCRGTRQIWISGSRRLSANLALGTMFPAVEKFSLNMISDNGTSWRTDAHPDSSTQYSLVPRFVDGTGNDLVVDIGILEDISSDVEVNLEKLGLELAPRLHLFGEKPITSPEEANLTSRQAKHHITEALRITSCHRIHLFFRGPDFLALFLGHRLNPLVQIQCHEWTVERQYVPTCCLLAFGS